MDALIIMSIVFVRVLTVTLANPNPNPYPNTKTSSNPNPNPNPNPYPNTKTSSNPNPNPNPKSPFPPSQEFDILTYKSQKGISAIYSYISRSRMYRPLTLPYPHPSKHCTYQTPSLHRI